MSRLGRFGLVAPMLAGAWVLAAAVGLVVARRGIFDEVSALG